MPTYTIKPLEWHEFGDGTWLRADSVFGYLYIQPLDTGGFRANGPHGTNSEFPTVQEATEFVTRAYQRLIRSCLTPAAPDTPATGLGTSLE
jgi:hypothetical protein